MLLSFVIKKNAKEFLKNLTMQHRQLKKETASFFPSKRQQTRWKKYVLAWYNWQPKE